MGRVSVVDMLANRTVARTKTKDGMKYSITITGQANKVAVVSLINYFLDNAGSSASIKGAQDSFVWMPGKGDTPKIVNLNMLVKTLNANQTTFKFALKYQSILQITELNAVAA